jgi:hypothetical protein
MTITKLAESGGLSIPIFRIDRHGKDVEASEPFILRRSILESAFSVDELRSLAIVNLNLDPTKNPSVEEMGELLKHREFPDGVKRGIAFSSNNNFYFTDTTLKRQIIDFVATEPDAAFRYGSLLTSDCFRGTATLNNLRIKLVDFQNPEFCELQTGDCHGKVAPWLAEQLGAEADTPFQFRLAWREQWAEGSENASSFLSKGTLLVDAALTTDRGYDLILDRSSIKGIQKAQLDELLPCGDYTLPQAVMGNRSNAKVTEYDGSWQFTVWFSEDAVLKDFGPPTQKLAQKLAEVQQDPLRLARYIVEQHDKRQAYIAEHQSQNEAEPGLEEEPAPIEKSNSRMTEILRADRYGQLLESPKVADFMRDFVARSWRDLAVKTGFKHSSAMAMPAPELERGTICAPHLPEGDVVVTRYPIVSRDNIRLYHNTHNPELHCQSQGLVSFNSEVSRFMQTKGAVWINPQDAAEFHQADFDGDQLIATPAKRMPHIAQEIHRAEAAAVFDFEQVKQRPKVPYSENPQYLSESGSLILPQVAAASSQHKVGAIANAIGIVQSSQPTTGEDIEPFEFDQRKLLNRLFKALQVEVDYQKNSERHEDIKEIGGAKLLKQVNRWRNQHPVHFFEFKKDRQAYRHYPIPTAEAGSSSVNAIPRAIVNPLWEATQLQERQRDEFRYLFPKPDIQPERWQKYLDYANDLKGRFKEAIVPLNPASSEFAEHLATVYEGFREEINAKFKKPGQRHLIASAVWHTQHTPIDFSKKVAACQNVAQNLPISFGLDPLYQVPNEAIPRAAYVLSIPFGSGKPESDRVIRTKEKLDAIGIQYDAVISPRYPVVDFVLKPLSKQPHPQKVERLIEKQSQKYGSNVIDPDRVDPNLWIVPPRSYRWAASTHSSGKAALAYSLFSDEICQQLQSFQVRKIGVLGLQYNDFKDEPFTKKAAFTITVDRLKLKPDDPQWYVQNGKPALSIDGKILGVFSQQTPKLPVGTTFTATVERQGNQCFLHVDPRSVQLPEAIQASSHSRSQPGTVPVILPNGKSTMTEPNKPNEVSNEQSQQLTQLLMFSVAAMYQDQVVSGKSANLAIDPNLQWKASVRPSGETVVHERSGGSYETIARFNIHSKEVTKSLSDQRAALFATQVALHQAAQMDQHSAHSLTRASQSHQAGMKKQVEQE